MFKDTRVYQRYLRDDNYWNEMLKKNIERFVDPYDFIMILQGK